MQTVKNIVDADIINDCSNGVCRYTFNGRICDSTATHTVDRAVGEVQRALCSKNCEKVCFSFDGSVQFLNLLN